MVMLVIWRNWENTLRDCGKREILTLIDVQKKTEISTGYLSEIERGNRVSPHPTILRKLAEVYGVGPVEVMEVAGYLAQEGKKAFSQKDEIEWAISTIFRDPTYGLMFDKVRVKSMPLGMKIKVIKTYEAMSGKKLLL